jgi:hypothetical protein
MREVHILDLCSEPNVIGRMRWASHMNLTGENVRPEGKRVLVIRRCKWEDNINMDLK